MKFLLLLLFPIWLLYNDGFRFFTAGYHLFRTLYVIFFHVYIYPLKQHTTVNKWMTDNKMYHFIPDKYMILSHVCNIYASFYWLFWSYVLSWEFGIPWMTCAYGGLLSAGFYDCFQYWYIQDWFEVASQFLSLMSPYLPTIPWHSICIIGYFG